MLPKFFEDIEDKGRRPQDAGRFLGLKEIHAVICAENIEKQTLAAQNEGQCHPVEKPGRMSERSGHQKSIPPREIEAVGIGTFARENVVVREHYPLGASFRA